MSDNSVVRFLGGDNMRKSNEFGERYFYTLLKLKVFFFSIVTPIVAAHFCFTF